jgi:hypothetical protein
MSGIYLCLYISSGLRCFVLIKHVLVHFKVFRAAPRYFGPVSPVVFLAAFTRAGHKLFIYSCLESTSVCIFPHIWGVSVHSKVFILALRFFGSIQAQFYAWQPGQRLDMNYLSTKVWNLSLSVYFLRLRCFVLPKSVLVHCKVFGLAPKCFGPVWAWLYAQQPCTMARHDAIWYHR